MKLAKVLSYDTDGGKIYRVFFENGVEEEFSDEEFFEHGLYETELTLSVSYDRLMEKVYEKRAYMRAVSFLRGSLKPEKAVREKLRDEGFSAEIIYSVMERLREELCVDDRRFCMKHIKKRLENGNSRLHITAELREKGIEDGLIGECLAEAQVNDREQAAKLALKKLKAGDKPEKIKRYLSGKGFSLSTILSVFEDVEINSYEDGVYGGF